MPAHFSLYKFFILLHYTSMDATNGKRSLVILTGPCAAGKDTLLKLLNEEFASGVSQAISHTTRPPRANEKNGVNYHFVTVEDFKQGVANGEFIEHVQYNGNYYGVTYRAVQSVLDAGKTCTLIVNIDGCTSIRKNAKFPVVYFFVHTSKFEDLETRIRKRSMTTKENEETIKSKLEIAKEELSYFESHKNEWDYALVNDDLDKCYAELKAHLSVRCIKLD